MPRRWEFVVITVAQAFDDELAPFRRRDRIVGAGQDQRRNLALYRPGDEGRGCRQVPGFTDGEVSLVSHVTIQLGVGRGLGCHNRWVGSRQRLLADHREVETPGPVGIRQRLSPIAIHPGIQQLRFPPFNLVDKQGQISGLVRGVAWSIEGVNHHPAQHVVTVHRQGEWLAGAATHHVICRVK